MATIKQKIEFVLSGETKVKNAFKALSREQRDLINEFRSGNKTYDETRNALKDISRQYDNAAQGADSFRNSIKSLRAEQKLANQTRLNEDRYAATSRRVAASGDFQTNLGASSALLQQAGAGGASQTVSIVGELVVLTEELPRLKEAVKGLPSAARAAADAFGTNLTSLGALGAATAALAVTYNLAAAAAQKNLEALNNQLSLRDQQRALEAEFSQLSADEIESRIQELELKKQVTDANLQESEALEKALNSTNFFIRAIGELSALLGVGNQAFKASDKDLKKDRLEAKKVNQELAVAQNAATEAAKGTSKAVRDSASARAKENSELLSSTKNAFSQTQKANTVAKQAEQELAKERERSAASTANAARAETTAIRERTKSDGFVTGGFRTGGRPRRSSRSSGGLSQAQADRNALTNSVNDNRRSAGEAYQDALRGINERVFDAVADLRVNQDRAFEDAFSSGNILGLRDTTKDIRRANEDLNRDANRDRLRAEQDYNRNLVKIAQDGQRQIQQAYVSGAQQIVQSLNNQFATIGSQTVTPRQVTRNNMTRTRR